MPVTTDPKTVREQSIVAARRRGIAIPDSLPVIDDPIEPRRIGDVLDRMMCLHAVAAFAYGLDRATTLEWIRSEKIEDSLTPREIAFLGGRIRDKEPFRVQVEANWALAWSVSLVKELDWTSCCSPSFSRLLPNLKKHERSAALRAKCQIRSLDEIRSQRDLAYCVHWGVRQACVAGAEVAVDLSIDELEARRRALEWLLIEQRWDAIALDT